MKIITLILLFITLTACNSGGSKSQSSGTGNTAPIVSCTISNAQGNGLSSIAGVLAVSGNIPNCRVLSCNSGYQIDNDLKSCLLSSGNDNNSLAPNNLIYLPNPITLYVDQLISIPYTPTINNCNSSNPCSFSLQSGGSLPSGVSLNPSTGAISGLPTAPKVLTTYIIRATNSKGSTTQSVSIKAIFRPISGLTIMNNNAVYKISEPINNNIISYTSGAGSVQSMSISPTLPIGLNLTAIGTQQWAITGTPSLMSPKTNYTITAIAPDGTSSTIPLSIEISTPPTILNYNLTPECFNGSGNDSGYVICNYNFGQPINPLIATFNGDNVYFRVAITSPYPTLPSGIMLNTDGSITTTSYGPFESTDQLCGINSYCVYQIEAYNSLGSISKLFKIKVSPTPAPTSFNYANNTYMFRTLTNIGNVDLVFPQGIPNCYQTSACFEITPSLPDGLSFSKSTGRITGAPSMNSKQSPTVYTVVARDTRGNITSLPFSIEVKERLPVFKYTANGIYVAKKNIDIDSTGMPRVDNSDGLDTPACGPTAIPITSFSVSPNLPIGLSLNTGSYQCGDVFTGGTITGTPQTLSTEQIYTITGCNDGGCSDVSIKLEVSPNITSVTAGESHACALIEEVMGGAKSVMCWGNNEFSQIGNNFVANDCNGTSCFKEARYIKYNNSLLTNVLSISSGKNHNCAILKEQDAYGGNGSNSYQARGRVLCWGDNRQHQLGINSVSSSVSDPSSVLRFDNDLPLQNIYSVYSGGNTSCAIGNDDFGNVGAVYCWGENYGPKAVRIGLNTNALENASMFHSLAVGDSHICGLKLNYVYDADPEAEEYYIESGDKVYCWGKNTHGQLGNNASISNTYTNVMTPVVFSNNNVMNGISAIISGENHTCAYSLDEPLLGINHQYFYCWGDNTNGQVTGNANGLVYNTPQQVLGINGASSFSGNILKVGTNAKSTIFQTSLNEYAIAGKLPFLGQPYNTLNTQYPIQLLHNYAPNIGNDLNPFYSGGSQMKSTNAINFYCDTLSNNSKLYCFGINDKGQLGNNTTDSLLFQSVKFNYSL